MPDAAVESSPPRLLDQLRQQIRVRHYSLRTEQAYVHWVRAYVRFHGLRHPAAMGRPEVEAFLVWLAAERGVSAATHRQALSALLFLYQKVLQQEVPWIADIGRPRHERRLPVVLSAHEVAQLLEALDGQQRATGVPHGVIGRLLYGTGMRLLEGLRLRVKDVDFERRAVVVRQGKGAKDRIVMLPASLEQLLHEQIGDARAVWRADRAAGLEGVHLPDALARKNPRAPRSWPWHWVFPQAAPSVDPRSGALRRHPTCSKAASSAPSSSRSTLPATAPASRPRRTRCAIRSRRICCSPATTSAPCRSCSATPTSARR